MMKEQITVPNESIAKPVSKLSTSMLCPNILIMSKVKGNKKRGNREAIRLYLKKFPISLYYQKMNT